MLRKVRMGVSVRGGISHWAGPTQHLRVWQTASVEVGHGGCVGFLVGFLGRKWQGNGAFFYGWVGWFGLSWGRGFFFVFNNVLGWWRRGRRRKAWLLCDCGLLVGVGNGLLYSSLHLGVRSTSLKKNKTIFLSPLIFYTHLPPSFPTATIYLYYFNQCASNLPLFMNRKIIFPLLPPPSFFWSLNNIFHRVFFQIYYSECVYIIFVFFYPTGVFFWEGIGWPITKYCVVCLTFKKQKCSHPSEANIWKFNRIIFNFNLYFFNFSFYKFLFPLPLFCIISALRQ